MSQTLMNAARRHAPDVDRLFLESFNLDAVLGDTEARLRLLLPTNVVLVVKRAIRPCLIHGSRRQAEQVLSDFVRYAGDAMPDGGTLAIELHAISVAGREFVRMVIADTGKPERPTIVNGTARREREVECRLRDAYATMRGWRGRIFVDRAPDAGTWHDVLFQAATAEAVHRV